MRDRQGVSVEGRVKFREDRVPNVDRDTGCARHGFISGLGYDRELVLARFRWRTSDFKFAVRFPYRRLDTFQLVRIDGPFITSGRRRHAKLGRLFVKVNAHVAGKLHRVRFGRYRGEICADDKFDRCLSEFLGLRLGSPDRVGILPHLRRRAAQREDVLTVIYR